MTTQSEKEAVARAVAERKKANAFMALDRQQKEEEEKIRRMYEEKYGKGDSRWRDRRTLLTIVSAGTLERSPGQQRGAARFPRQQRGAREIPERPAGGFGCRRSRRPGRLPSRKNSSEGSPRGWKPKNSRPWSGTRRRPILSLPLDKQKQEEEERMGDGWRRGPGKPASASTMRRPTTIRHPLPGRRRSNRRKRRRTGPSPSRSERSRRRFRG